MRIDRLMSLKMESDEDRLRRRFGLDKSGRLVAGAKPMVEIFGHNRPRKRKTLVTEFGADFKGGLLVV